LASVTVGSTPPRPKQAGPGNAPAERGPTVRKPEVTAAMLPPPAPTVLMSICRILTGKAPTRPSVVMVNSPPRTRHTSVEVPPMSQVITSGKSAAWPT
jgi:hypothetical protein